MRLGSTLGVAQHAITPSAAAEWEPTARPARPPRRVSRLPSGLAALVAAIWGLCYVLIQASLPSATPLLLAGLRALIGGAVLGVWIALTRWSARRGRPSARHADRFGRPCGVPPLRTVATLAATNVALAFGAMYLAAGQSVAAVASTLSGSQPVLLSAAAWALFGERAPARTLIGLCVAMAGLVLVASTASGSTSIDGVALSLLAAAAPAAGTVVMRRLGSTIDVPATASAQLLLGGLMLVSASARLEPWGNVSWPPATIASLLVLGVLGTGLAYAVWFWLLGRASLTALGTSLFLVPVVGVVSGILAGNRLEPAELAGAAALLGGVALVSLREPRGRS